jgi:drug/metabolite transporter (DMT)-like permease
VAQRAGMAHMGPFFFNGVRFAMGAAVLAPVLAARRGSSRAVIRSALPGGLAAGLVLFGGASLQQAGLVFTTAGKAGFITGLYVVLVPVLGILRRQRTCAGTWLGAVLAAAGLYLLSVTGSLSFAPGDLLVLAGALFWAAHVQVIGHLSSLHDPIALAMVQFAVCSVLSLAAALVLESPDPGAIGLTLLPLGYSGFLSVGMAYTLQVVAQRRAEPSHAAVIMSLETVAAALGGWLILGETMTARSLAGCALMLAGMLTSRLSRRTGIA